jgi:hypothetical protein
MKSRFNSVIHAFRFGLVPTLLLLSNSHGQCSASTNRIFRTESVNGDIAQTDAVEVIVKANEGKFHDELLPAEESSSGNWGTPTNGVQMSVRFYGTNFTTGKSVPAVIIFRNVGTTPVLFGTASWDNYPYILSLRYEGVLVEPRIPATQPGQHDGSIQSRNLEPGTQRRDILCLDHIFNLNRLGWYELTVERGSGVPGVRVCSGTARFQLVAKPLEFNEAPDSDRRLVTNPASPPK